MRLVVILASEGVALLDITGPLQVFATASDEASETSRPLYEVLIASAEGGLIKGACGVELMTCSTADLGDRLIDTLLVAGRDRSGVAVDRRLVNWLAAKRGSVRRIGSNSSGAFLLAAAGLLEGRVATTHWAFRAALARLYPNVLVKTDGLFVSDEGVWTSAGVTAGIDMAIEMVELDHGPSVALRTSRRLVLYMKRSGGQSQISGFLRAQAINDDNLRRLVEWILANPSAALNTKLLAKRAHMSSRSFFRAFQEHLATSPREFVEWVRLEAAQRMLEQTDEGINRVARKAGFSTPDSMRRAFRRHFETSPLSYRERFNDRRARSSQRAIGAEARGALAC